MTANRILLVDDEPDVLAGYERFLRQKFAVTTALSGGQALALVEQDGPFSVVVTGLQMPGMNGIQFLRKLQEKAPESVRLMLTSQGDRQTIADAVNQGHVFSFLTKPCPPEQLESALDNAVRQYRLVVAEKELLEVTLKGAVQLLTDILSMVDPQAFGRAQRLRDEARIVAKQFGLARRWELELGAMLSQIGYVAIPPGVLTKARAGEPLSGPEKDMLTRAPATGADLLAKIPRLQPVAEIVRYQLKNYDGTGFPPDSVAGDEIPIGARVLRVLSDLLAAEGHYKSRLQAFQQMQTAQGRYDPKVLEAVGARFDIYVEKAPAQERKAIAFSQVEVGHILVADLRTGDGTLLLTKGTRISPPLLQKLRNFAGLNGIKEPVHVLAELVLE